MSATIHVQHFSSHLTCLRQVQNRIDDVVYIGDLSHRLPRFKRIFGSIAVERRIHNARGETGSRALTNHDSYPRASICPSCPPAQRPDMISAIAPPGTHG